MASVHKIFIFTSITRIIAWMKTRPPIVLTDIVPKMLDHYMNVDFTNASINKKSADSSTGVAIPLILRCI